MRHHLTLTSLTIVFCLGCDSAAPQQQATRDKAVNDLREPGNSMHNDPNNQVSENVDEALDCEPQYVALREHQFETDKPDESMVRCDFRCISFQIPAKLASRVRIVRTLPSSVWLVFENDGRFVQIPLPSHGLASRISDPPSELVDTTLPGMIATIAKVASGDSTSELTPGERSVYDWAIANREAIGIAAAMDRFAVRSSGTLHAILISANPGDALAAKQIRSWLVWEETESGKSGAMMVSDSSEDSSTWINTFATSLEFVPNAEENDLTAKDYEAMDDDGILSMLTTHSPTRP